MTYGEIYQKALNMLRQNENASPEFEARILTEFFFGLGRISFVSMRNEDADPEDEKNFFAAVEKRISGYPFQYIVQSWSFMDSWFSVGEGVLIPRDDTEVCVREGIKIVKDSGNKAPVIIDLCSGSGAIAVSLAKEYPNAHIFALEISDKAFEYLNYNIEMNEVKNNVIPLNVDIYKAFEDFSDGFFDIIISNPPYIKTEEISNLQKEVQYEPKIALDGGSDGLDFYRCIAENWFSKLKSGGSVVLEIGEEQGEAVSDIFKKQGGRNIKVHKDIQNLDRAVTVNK